MKLFFISIFLFSINFSCQTVRKKKVKKITWNEHLNKVYDDGVKFGIKVYENPINIIYKKNEKEKFSIHIQRPKTVFKARKPQGWGFVQFPRLIKKNENTLAVIWNMNEDDVLARPKTEWKFSKDNGKSWFFNNEKLPYDEGVSLSDGSKLKLYSKKYKVSNFPHIGFKDDSKISKISKSKKKDLISFKKYDELVYYNVENLNDSLTSFNSIKTKKGVKKISKSIVSYLPKTIKHSFKGIYYNQLWGRVMKLKDGSLLTCQYPYFFRDENDNINPSGVAFYKSLDDGESWSQISKIPFSINKNLDQDNFKYRTFYGFTEPIFQIVNDQKIVCILRSSPTYRSAPMYMTISNDLGESWSKPKAITNHGVLPQLLLLNNGVLVLSYGRPGVQVRFLDTKKEELEWSDPIEMLRVNGLKGQVSCGYTNLVAMSENEFLIVYSDFRSRDDEGNLRKSILVREISIKITDK
ncbi:sialidase family protein [Tenacibaculum sp. M341]|uniref:sialidase family protein n=1 Tax=Tenacibaculum sp. M341 TaxID=2530339 RepID=UPI001044C088|nr:sialidase family protein [Tenacibaculum sp. M341]TCI91745.1 exo-alpha-sialidase [Tenacibaculum sp. M341]